MTIGIPAGSAWAGARGVFAGQAVFEVGSEVGIVGKFFR